ncbi:MAG: GFA family protein [Sphingomicrobium sp.]
MSERMTGRCACGKVRYSVPIADDEAYLCHCRMCQRATGSVSIAFKTVKAADVAWDGEPDWFDSSPIAARPFCASCGTSLGFKFKKGSEKMDLTVASFDDPARFTPKWHFGAESICPAWLNTESLPRHKSSDYQELVERWIAATGKMPD